MNPTIPSFVIGLLVGVVLTASIAAPRVGRILTRVAATLAMAAGVGGLVWFLASQGSLTAIRVGPLRIAQPHEAAGWSAGLFTAGVIALVLSFLAGPARRNP